MKLYMHPVSMTSRPVRLFMAEKGIKADEEVVDLMTGQHYQEPYASLNPNKLVPMIDDDGFRKSRSNGARSSRRSGCRCSTITGLGRRTSI